MAQSETRLLPSVSVSVVSIPLELYRKTTAHQKDSRMKKPQYKHPVSIRVVAAHSEIQYLNARDCVTDNEIIFCVENGKYYEGFTPLQNLGKYYFREFEKLKTERCDLCGARDEYGNRIALQKIVVRKPHHDIKPSSTEFIKKYKLDSSTLEKFICSECREAIVNEKRS